VNIDLEKLQMRPVKDSWVADRATYLGGTDIAAILGLHPYKTPRIVYMEKKGLKAGPELNQAMLHGSNLELYVMQLYRLHTGKTLHKSKLYRDKNIPFFAANPDYEIRGEPGLLECKTTNQFMAEEWGDEEDAVPNQYNVQTQWQMAITGRMFVDLAVLIGGQQFRVYHIERDEELIETLKFRAYDWWTTYMESDCPPPLTGNEPDCRMVKEQFPDSCSEVRYATPEVEELCNQLNKITAMCKTTDTEKKRLQNLIKVEMENCGELHFAGGKIIWRTDKNNVRAFKPTFKEEKTCQAISQQQTQMVV